MDRSQAARTSYKEYVSRRTPKSEDVRGFEISHVSKAAHLSTGLHLR